MATRQHEHGCAVQARGGQWLKRHHGTEKHGAGQDLGSEQEQGGGDVGAVGVTNGDDFTEVTTSRLVFDKIGEFVGATDEVSLVKDPGGQAAEKAGLAIFEDLSARAQESRAGTKDGSEGDEVIFITSSAVKEQKCGQSSGFEAIRHNWPKIC